MGANTECKYRNWCCQTDNSNKVDLNYITASAKMFPVMRKAMLLYSILPWTGGKKKNEIWSCRWQTIWPVCSIAKVQFYFTPQSQFTLFQQQQNYYSNDFENKLATVHNICFNSNHVGNRTVKLLKLQDSWPKLNIKQSGRNLAQCYNWSEATSLGLKWGLVHQGYWV